MKTILLTIPIALITNISFSQIFWNPEIEVASSTYNNYNPHVVLDGNDNPVVSWGDGNQNFLVSNWNGASFNTPLEVNGVMDVMNGSNFGPEIASYGDTIYGIFKQNPASTGNIYLVRSFDGGTTFNTPVQVDNVGTDKTEFVHVAADDSGNPIVAFNRFDASWNVPRWVFTKSTDFGVTFAPDVVASGWSGGGNVACECCPAALASSGSSTIVAYRDNLSNLRDIWVGLSSDGGTTFTSGMDVDQSAWGIASCPTTGPDIEIVGDTLYTTYMSSATGQGTVYTSKASISSGSRSAGYMITGPFGGLSNQNYPRLSISGNQGVIVWQQVVNGNTECVISVNTSIAGAFPATYEAFAPGYAVNPDVVLDGNVIHVVWRDYQTGSVKYRQGFISGVGLSELSISNKEVVKVVDLMGRETEFKPNTPLILIYSDGSTQRVMDVK